MRYSKLIILTIALAQSVSGIAQAQVSGSTKNAMKFICSGKPEKAGENLCKEFCADKANVVDAVCTASKKEEKAESAALAAAVADDNENDDDKPEIIATPIATAIETPVATGPILMPTMPKASETPQRAEGETADGLKWKVHFNFPVCDHSDKGFPKGAYCEATDSSASDKANGDEAQLLSWIKDPETKGLYLSYFSFSNKNIAAALCAESSKRPDVKIVIYVDKGETQIGGLETNLGLVDKELSTPGSKRYIEGYQTGCIDRLKPRETARGSGGFGGVNYLQHTKIFMALDQAELPESPSDLNNWLKNSQRIRFTSSSANMSPFGTTLHFENWIFFDAPAKNYVALQNVCTMLGFKSATDDATQREQFKSTYKACEQQIASAPMKNLKFFVVPSDANDMGQGPSNAAVGLIESALKSIKVSIHRFTTSTLSDPLVKKAKSGIPVMMIQDDDTLRKGVKDGGKGADVGADDVAIMRKNLASGVDISFMQTNADTTVHMFHSKYIIADESRVLQGAGNFTGTSMNIGRDGNFEHFYIITIPELAKAYSDAWDYLHTLATPRKQHPVGNNEYWCTYSKGILKELIDCNTKPDPENPKAPMPGDAHLKIP